MHLAALHDGALAEDSVDRGAQRFAAVDDDEQRAVGPHAAPLEVGEQALARRRVFRRAFVKPKQVLVAAGVDAEGDKDQVLADVQPVDDQRDQVDLAQIPLCHRAEMLRLFF